MTSPKKPKVTSVEVAVTKLAAPTPQWPQGYQFALSGSAVSGGQLKFKNNKHPGFIVVFYIVEAVPGNPAMCQFLPDPDDALWVKPYNSWDPAACPSSPCSWDQFFAIDVADYEPVAGNPAADIHNKVLVAMNKNDYDQMFAFTLRFTAAGAPGVIVYDPIGSNQNGGQ